MNGWHHMHDFKIWCSVTGIYHVFKCSINACMLIVFVHGDLLIYVDEYVSNNMCVSTHAFWCFVFNMLRCCAMGATKHINTLWWLHMSLINKSLIHNNKSCVYVATVMWMNDVRCDMHSNYDTTSICIVAYTDRIRCSTCHVL